MRSIKTDYFNCDVLKIYSIGNLNEATPELTVSIRTESIFHI